MGRRAHYQCMDPACALSTGRVDKLYCADHEEALKAPERQAPRTAGVPPAWQPDDRARLPETEAERLVVRAAERAGRELDREQRRG